MTPQDAIDVMNGIFSAAWTGVGQPLDRVRWDDLPGTVPDETAAWARVTIRHNDGPMRAFGQGGGLYSNTGIMTVQVFTPIGGANQQAYDLAYAAVIAIRKASNMGVSFRNARIKEVGGSGAFQQTNVLADFSYDD